MGKSNSKLKKKNRTQSIAWSFRFPSVSSLSMRRRCTATGPQMAINDWLTALKLDQYQIVFEKFKYIEEVMRYTDEDLKDLGVKNDSHRTKMIASINALKRKYNRRDRSNVRDKVQRHSVAVDATTLINQNAESDILVLKNINQSKSLSNIKMETICPEIHSDPVQLKKVLEWELSLDARDLRSHAWYHGSIGRNRADEIISDKDGDFLVRDCMSQPGNFVLSCCSKGQNLHFVISKVVLYTDTVYERVQYRFEDDSYDTVPDLITFYVGSGKPITTASGARIHNPRNRLYPLSFYAELNHGYVKRSSTPLSQIDYKSPLNSPSRKKLIPLGIPAKQQRSLSLLPTDDVKPFCNSLPRRSFTSSPKIQRITSDPSLSPSSEKKEFIREDPPPKPSRASFVRNTSMPDVTSHSEMFLHRKFPFYHTSGSDSGNGSGDSEQSCNVNESLDGVTPTSTLRRSSGVVIKNPKYSDGISTGSSVTLKEDSGIDEIINVDFPSFFDLETFSTLLLPMDENRPLDISALESIYIMLQQSGSRILANHLTKVDLELTTNDLKFNKLYNQQPMSGIELSTLPHGHQLRLDLIERTECLKLLVATTILSCGTESERAEILNKWIEVAIDTKTALGNLYGFCSIMLGLCMPQILRLDSTWHVLRQKYTDSAFNFEAKLKPMLKSMNQGTNPLAPNTTIPNLIPIILLQEQTLQDIIGNADHRESYLISTCISSWEMSSSDFGISSLYTHLSSARSYCKSLPTFRRNSDIVLSESKTDDLLLDMFKTEFHLKFLWGSRGSLVSSSERYSKFEEILNLMSEKCEPELHADSPSHVKNFQV